MSRQLGILLVSLCLLLAAPVRAQTLPVADAGDDVALECAGPGGTGIALDGSGSSDPDGEELTYTWTSPSFPPGTTLTGAVPTGIPALPLGTHVITLEVDDGVDGTATDEVAVTVRDTVPPVLQLGSPPPLSLWPPNHSYHGVDVSRFVISASDVCDGSLGADDARFVHATSDEPENGTGDGDTENDMRIGDECRSLEVRSERKGNGDGRVYRAEIAVADASGNTSSGSVEVARVRKAPPKPAVDSGVAATAHGICEPEVQDPGMCPALPDPSCEGALPTGRSSLILYASPRGDSRDRLLFLIADADTDAPDLGDPDDDTGYQLCVYGREDDSDDAFGLIANPIASPGEAWRETRSGFVYRARRGDDDGLTRVLLRARNGRRGAILVSGAGRALGLPALPLDASDGVEVQLHNDLGQCWGASFDEALRNTDRVFRAIAR